MHRCLVCSIKKSSEDERKKHSECTREPESMPVKLGCSLPDNLLAKQI